MTALLRGWVGVLMCGALLLAAASAQAQSSAEPTPTPMIFGAVNEPLPTPIPDDPRPGVCAAPYLSGFVPVMVRPGDTLAALMVGVTNLSITQIAALNCIDDPDALPVGAVIWLPGTLLPEEVPVGTDSAAPSIRQFRANRTRLTDAQSVTFSWTAEGAAAYFYACPTANVGAACPHPLTAVPLPLTHTTDAISGFLYAGEYRYRLEVVTGTGAVTRDLTVSVICAQATLGTYSGRTPCPAQPAQTMTLVWQPFERGQMWWFADTLEIWVLTDDGRVRVFEDTYREGDLEPTSSPPEGRQAPVRGFGSVWAQLGGAEGVMGWALTAETGAELHMQAASRVSYTRFVQKDDGAVLAITLLPEKNEGWWATTG